MFLVVLLFISNALYSSDKPSAEPAESSGLAVTVMHAAEDALCNAALSLFERGTDAVITRYIRPHLTSMVHEVASSPNDGAALTPHADTVKRIVSGDLSVDSVPRKDMEELVLAAVQKTLEAKEKELADKANQIEGMFTTKSTIGISTVSGLLLAIVGSLAGAFGVKDTCTK